MNGVGALSKTPHRAPSPFHARRTQREAGRLQPRRQPRQSPPAGTLISALRGGTPFQAQSVLSQCSKHTETTCSVLAGIHRIREALFTRNRDADCPGRTRGFSRPDAHHPPPGEIPLEDGSRERVPGPWTPSTLPLLPAQRCSSCHAAREMSTRGLHSQS